MKTQKSFINEKATLYVVATPIGNLKELTPRAIEILENVYVIAAEDTRNSSQLLNKFEIKTKLIAHHNFNEKASTDGIIDILSNGHDVAIISDAGYPLISDPGYLLVSEAVKHDFNVVPVSGSNAGINALVASGLVTQPYIFYGFLSPNSGDAKKQLEELKNYNMTLIFYVSPHKVTKNLMLIREILGNRQACLARELTKKFEEFLRGTLDEIILESEDLKGEIVLVVEGLVEDKKAIDFYKLNLEIEECVQSGMSAKEAIKALAKKYDISKNELYNEYHKQIEEKTAFN